MLAQIVDEHTHVDAGPPEPAVERFARGLLASADLGEVKEGLIRNTEASVGRGTFGSPTFFVGNEIFFGKDRLRDVEEEIVSRGKGSA